MGLCQIQVIVFRLFSVHLWSVTTEKVNLLKQSSETDFGHITCLYSLKIPDEQFYFLGGVNVCYPETIGYHDHLQQDKATQRKTWDEFFVPTGQSSASSPWHSGPRIPTLHSMAPILFFIDIFYHNPTDFQQFRQTNIENLKT